MSAAPPEGAADVVMEENEEEAVVMEDLEADRRNEHLENMEKIRLEFDDLKEKMYAAKIEGLQKEMEMIDEGSHEEFVKRMGALETERETRKWLAERWRDYQLKNIQRIYDSESSQLEEEFANETDALRGAMTKEIVEKQKKLEEEKDHLSLQNLSGEESRPMTRSAHSLRTRKGPDNSAATREAQKKTINPPHIQYTLTDEEIWGDIQMIQKGSPTPEEQKNLLIDAINFVV